MTVGEKCCTGRGWGGFHAWDKGKEWLRFYPERQTIAAKASRFGLTMALFMSVLMVPCGATFRPRMEMISQGARNDSQRFFSCPGPEVETTYFSASLPAGNQKCTSDPDLLKVAKCMKNQLSHGRSDFFLFISFGNAAFVPFYRNWLCNTAAMDGVHERTLLIFSDEEGYNIMKDNSFGVLVSMIITGESNSAGYRAGLDFGKLGYWLLTSYRVQMVITLMQNEIPSLIFESDAIWIKNPLRDPCLYTSEHDLVVFQDNKEVGGLGFGWLLLRPTSRTVALLQETKRRFDKQLEGRRGQSPDTWAHEVKGEQQYAQEVIDTNAVGHIQLRNLSPSKYVSGRWYIEEFVRKEVQEDGVPYVLNFNWIIGNQAKIDRAKKWGHWFLQDEVTGTCADPVLLRAAMATMLATMHSLAPPTAAALVAQRNADLNTAVPRRPEAGPPASTTRLLSLSSGISERPRSNAESASGVGRGGAGDGVVGRTHRGPAFLPALVASTGARLLQFSDTAVSKLESIFNHFESKYPPSFKNEDGMDRRPSYPMNSAEGFRHVCRHQCDPRGCLFAAADVEPGDCVWVGVTSDRGAITSTAGLKALSRMYLGIKVPFVVISGSGDLSVPDGDAWHDGVHGAAYTEDAMWREEYAFMLDWPHLTAWFAANCHWLPEHAPKPEKLHCVPVGVENRYSEVGRLPRAFLRAMHDAARSPPPSRLLLLDAKPHPLKPFRKPAWDALQHAWVTVARGPALSHASWQQLVRDHKWVVCPVGHGYDTHRTWEVLMLGSLPVLQSSSLDSMYEGLPVLIVSDWSHVTPQLLEDRYEALRTEPWSLDRVFFPYWLDRMQRHGLAPPSHPVYNFASHLHHRRRGPSDEATALAPFQSSHPPPQSSLPTLPSSLQIIPSSLPIIPPSHPPSRSSAEAFFDEDNDMFVLRNRNAATNAIKISTEAGKPQLSYSVLTAPSDTLSADGLTGRLGNTFRANKNMIALAMVCKKVLPARIRFHGFEFERQELVFVDARGAPESISGATAEFRRAHCSGRTYNADDAFRLTQQLRSGTTHFLALYGVAGRATMLLLGVGGPGQGRGGRPCPPDLLRPDAIVGHVRSGDLHHQAVTKDSDVNPFYGQPPFFYWWSILTSSNFSTAILYVEDLRSPLTKMLNTASKRSGSRVQVRVSAPISQVLDDMLCAANVVVGQSTLGTIVEDSWNLRKVFVPYECTNTWYSIQPQKTWTAAINTDEYTPGKEWRSTPDQFVEMLVYDPGHISPLPCMHPKSGH